MFVSHDQDLEELEDDIVEVSSLKDLSRELIEECIKDQINNPFYSHTDYIEQFVEAYEIDKDQTVEDYDYAVELDRTALEFFHKILILLDNKYNLDLDFQTLFEMNIDTIKDICSAIYEFFVIDYENNIATFIISIIMESKDLLVDNIIKNKIGNETLSIRYKEKINNATYLTLISNIDIIIKISKDFTYTPDQFIDLFDCDEYSVIIIKDCIDNFIINGDFVPKFIDPLYQSSKDNIYDNIILKIQQKIYSNYLDEMEYQKEG